jgi:hypothetical protein
MGYQTASHKSPPRKTRSCVNMNKFSGHFFIGKSGLSNAFRWDLKFTSKKKKFKKSSFGTWNSRWFYALSEHSTWLFATILVVAQLFGISSLWNVKAKNPTKFKFTKCSFRFSFAFSLVCFGSYDELRRQKMNIEIW